MFFVFVLPVFQEPEPQPNQGGGGFFDFIANFMNPNAQQQEPPPQCTFQFTQNILMLNPLTKDPAGLTRIPENNNLNQSKFTSLHLDYTGRRRETSVLSKRITKAPYNIILKPL